MNEEVVLPGDFTTGVVCVGMGALGLALILRLEWMIVVGVLVLFSVAFTLSVVRDKRAARRARREVKDSVA